jgi:hypothetical protein
MQQYQGELPKAGQPVMGKAEDVMANAQKLWQEQGAERKKHPDKLTGFESLQQELWQAGFYGQTPYDSIHVGQWTAQTESAMRSALHSYETGVMAAQTPETFTEFLAQNQQFGQDGGAGKSKTATPAAPTINLTDPLAIKQQAQAAAQQALGMSLTEDQLNAFVTQFQSAEKQYQSQPAGSTITSPDLGSDAAAFAQSTDPHAYEQQQHQSYMDALVNLFSGPGATQRPNIAPTPQAV